MRDTIEAELRRFVIMDTVIIHGGQKGADLLAGAIATELGMWVWPCPAAWDYHGLSAGPRRNARMLAESRPDLVLAFPGGAGTLNMCTQATAAGVAVRRAG